MAMWGGGDWMVPADDLHNYWAYANNVDYLVEVTANERVNEFYMRFDYFSTEPVYDYLNVYSYSPDGNSTNWYFSDSVPYQGGNPVWGGMKIGMSPFTLGLARVGSTCSTTNTTPRSIEPR